MNAMTYTRKAQGPSAAPMLKIGRPDDAFEHEADRKADEVMSGTGSSAQWSISRMSIAPPLQRKCACGGSGEADGECEECRKKKLLQRSATGAGPATVPAVVGDVLRSSGTPLDREARSFFESRFGVDFSKVRIHTDAQAASSARNVAARAYTVGESIVFNSGQYSPQSTEGRRLLAHELTHVVQQNGGGGAAKHHPRAPRPVQHRAPKMIARDPQPGAQQLIEVKFPDGVRQLTQEQFEAEKQRTLRNLRSDLRRTAGLCDVGRDSQNDLMKEYHNADSLWDMVKHPKNLIGAAADIKAGVVPPYIGMWSFPKHEAEEGLAAADAGDIGRAARMAQQADRDYRDALHQWNAYREATIGGAEGVISNLETVRDVSFGIALAAGAVVAAPVIAGVAGAGALGTAGTALGTAAVTGAGGVVLGGGSTALGSYAATGKVDWKAVKKDAAKFGKQGAVTGLTAGLGSALNAAGQGAQLARPIVQQALRKCVTEAGINVTGEITSEALDKIAPPEKKTGGGQPGDGKEPKEVIGPKARAALTGCVSGALGVPADKLGKGVANKAVNTAVSAGVGYVDARLSGQSNEQALAAGGIAALTSTAVSAGHEGSEHAKAQRAAGKTAQTPGQPPVAEHAAAQPQAKKTQVPPPEKVPAGEPQHPQQKKADASRKMLHEEQKKSGTDAAPAILKEDAKASKKTAGGHDAVVTNEGVGRCSPGPCPVIHVEYAKELAGNARLKEWNERIQAMRKTNPTKAAEEAASLIRTLEAERHNAAKADPNEPHLDFSLDVSQKRQQQIQSGEKNLAVDRPLTFDIDEVLPVGGKGIKPQRAHERATSAENRQLLDPNTNRASKGTGIDPRELPGNRQPRKRTSVAQDPHALLTRRFSEVLELKRIFDRAVKKFSGRRDLSPTELKAEINRETRRIITDEPDRDAQAVRRALEEIGFEHVPGVGWAMQKSPAPQRVLITPPPQ